MPLSQEKRIWRWKISYPLTETQTARRAWQTFWLLRNRGHGRNRGNRRGTRAGKRGI